MQRTSPLIAAAVLASVSTLGTAQAQESPLAFDMVDSTALRLLDYSNTFTGAFTSAADGFQKYRRGAGPSIPFSLLDDSACGFSSDALGIIGCNNTEDFFGATDTANGDNPSGDVSASWVFDVTGAMDLGITIHVAAMGDFEASDFFEITASVDGSSEQLLFASTVDESSSQVYRLENGNEFTLNDPMQLQGVNLTNRLTAFRAPVSCTGDSLTLTLRASTDGGSEAFALQSLVVLENFEGMEAPPCAGGEPDVTLISALQGAGAASPLAGLDVTIEGVVVGDFQDNGAADSGNLSGFFIQEEAADEDGLEATSEGVFVFDSAGDVDVEAGQLVRVSGRVAERFGQTQLSASEVTVIGVAELPEPRNVVLPLLKNDALEAFEGMRVRFPQSLVISEYFNFDRFGEIVLALPLEGERRTFTPTAQELPWSPGYEQRLMMNQLSRVTLDDGRSSQNPDPAIHPNGDVFTLDNTFRGGDLVTNVTGVINYAFNRYRIQQTQAAEYAAANPRPVNPPEVSGSLRVASFNVLNYFTTLGSRGADTADEFARQRAKIISAITAMDADVVGLIEIENNDEAIRDLTTALNDAAGEGTYAFVDTGLIGSDEIKVAFIYQPATVTPVGDFAVLDSSVDPDFIDTKSRPALAQTFADQRGGAVTIAVNHFKSKGSPCDDIGDPDLGDGQGNCNGTRSAAAAALARWLATDPTGSGDPDTLIIGDLNAYREEDPIRLLRKAGYADPVRDLAGEFAYSYVFDGQFGYLDHALGNATLAGGGQVTGTAIWNINADEPDLIDYDTTFKRDAQDALYAPDAFRSSDHDPVIVGLRLLSKEDCKRGGWRTLDAREAFSFRNQGQCVSYFAAGTRRP